MAWTETTRRNYGRRTSRYASDVTDREWEFVAAFMPAPRRLGRPRKTDLREVVNALLYIASTGCQWRMLPKDSPPCSTVQRYFYEWRAMGLWSRINHHLVMEARELEGKGTSPTAGAIDSQGVKTTESGGIRRGGHPCLPRVMCEAGQSTGFHLQPRPDQPSSLEGLSAIWYWDDGYGDRLDNYIRLGLVVF